MLLPLFSERAPLRIVRFAFLCVGVIALVASAISYASLQDRQAVDTNKSAGAVAAGKPSTRAGVDSLSSRNEANSFPAAGKSYGQLPLSFEINRGQSNPEVKFIARGQGYGLFLTSSSAILRFARPANTVKEQNAVSEGGHETSSAGSGTLSMRFKGSRPVSRPTGLDELPGKSNYFIGNQARNWHTNIALYSKVQYRNVYPGIDLVYYGNQRQLEYDLIVAPGASPGRIQIAFEGTDKITVDSAGDLLLSTAAGDVRQLRPIAYQEVNGTRREVAASYRLDRDVVRFEVGTYDRGLPLMIDPVLVYSSFVGGTGNDQGLAIAVDSQGSAYLTGSTLSTDFPLASALQGTKGTSLDAFVVKLNPTGTAMVYATYLGANGDDVGNAIAVDSQGGAYVTGLTGSGSFPTTPGVFQDAKDGSVDGFVTKLNPSGSALEYSTFIGGDNSDTAFGIAVDPANRAYVVGRTDSTRFRNIPFATPRNGSPVYKSTDAAANWSPSAAGLTASIVNCLTQDPITATTIYAGTSIGVFKSLNSGASWSLTGSNPPVTAPLFTNAVVVDPSNPSTIYAATTEGVYKSTNGGGSYTQKNDGLHNQILFALAADPNAPAILYAGTFFGVFKSTNGGDSWVEINNGTNSDRVNEIVIDPTQTPATTIYLGMSNSGLLKSTNGGALWTPINTGLSNFALVNALAMDPMNPSTLYAGVSGLGVPVFKTTNGGASWSPSGNGLTFSFEGQPAVPLVNTVAVDPITTSTLYATASAGPIYKSSDGGANWTQSNTGFINSLANAIAVDRSNTTHVYTATAIGTDAFALRLNSSGGLEYLVNFGGDESDETRAVAVDTTGNAYIAGSTNSSNLPVVNAFQPAKGGFSDAFVAKLNGSGTTFNYLTYLGGGRTDQARGIAVRNGNAYVIGTTSSPNFPLANALKGTLSLFDTDAFITKLTPAGNALDFSTYLGGQNVDQGFGIAVDSSGSAYVTGVTSSPDFPVHSAPQSEIGGGNDAFVTKLTSAGTAIAYSTYLGGSFNDQANGIAVDTAGNAYMTGNTVSSNFPTVNPLQSYRGITDAFVAKLGAAADIVVSMTGSPDSLPYRSTLTYTIVVSNAGEVAAENVRLNNTLLSGTGVISINTTRGTCTGNRFITCDFSTLDPGATATVTIVVVPPAVATMINTAVGTTTTPEVTSTNNTATLNTAVLFTDLMLRKTSALQLTEIGAVNTYIITVTNRGPAAASTITVTDNLPPETTFVACTSTNSGVCDGVGNNRTVTVPSLAVGASFTATIAARVNNTVTAGTVISNTASMTSVVPDINPNNDAQTATTTAKVASSGPVLNGLVAFTSRDGSINSGGDDVWLTNPDGSGQSDITFGSGLSELGPAWSPDGLRIAFQGSPVGIFVMNGDGSNQVQLTTGGSDSFPSWSPDGTRIAFGGSRFSGLSGVLIMNSDGTNVKKVADGGTPAWSPDGTRIAFSNGFGIGMVFADGSGVRTISFPRVPFVPFGWSPDSSKLVLAMSDDSALGLSIFTVNADGTGLLRIDNTSGGQTPCWSPDGTKIAFSRSASAGVDPGIYTINLDGTGLLKISGDVNGGVYPNWQRQPPNFTPLPPSFSISGLVTHSVDGTPFPAAINMTGTLTRTVSANPSGNYVFKGLPLGGNYTLTPSFGNSTSNPPNRQYNNLTANQTGADFSITFPPRQPISGFVRDRNGLPLPGVRVVLGNSFNPPDAFTDNNGFFTFGNAFPGAQAYVIAIPQGTYADYIFDPTIIFLQDGVSNNFIGRPKTASLSGTVTVGGVGRSGVALFTSQPQPLSTSTDANGNYTFNSVGEGVTLTVQVDARTFPFTPATQTVTVNGQTTGVNFAAPLNQFLISGQVTNLGSPGIAGVTMTLGGAASATTQTDNQGNFSFGPLPGNVAYTVAAARTGFSFVPTVATVPNLTSNTQLAFTGFANLVRFFPDSASVSVGETGGMATLTVVRSGLLSETLKVDYRTNDGTAAQRTDYTATFGTLIFGPQEQSKTIVVPISDDAYVEGDESFTVTLSNPVGGMIGDIGSAVVTIQDDDTATPTVNPLDSAGFFVRQHYLDFLNRVPDSSGQTFWTEQITDCGLDTACTEIKRINVSAAFFLSIEFQQTGYLVERLYKSSYGDAVGTSTTGGVHQLPVPIVQFDEFLPDTQEIGRGFVVGAPGADLVLENNKQAFIAGFVQRTRFMTAYPTSLTPAQFVDALFTNTGVTPSGTDRTAAIAEFGGAATSADVPARARALRRVAENATFTQQESNKAFVLMQYFGYMRRSPNSAPDADHSGYEFWLTKLNQFGGNFVNAEMVKAFIVSGEYRQRFGP